MRVSRTRPWLSGPRPGQGSRPDKAGEMFPLPSAWTLEAGLSSEAGILELWDTSIPVISGTYTNVVYSSLPHHGP